MSRKKSFERDEREVSSNLSLLLFAKGDDAAVALESPRGSRGLRVAEQKSERHFGREVFSLKKKERKNNAIEHTRSLDPFLSTSTSTSTSGKKKTKPKKQSKPTRPASCSTASASARTTLRRAWASRMGTSSTPWWSSSEEEGRKSRGERNRKKNHEKKLTFCFSYVFSCLFLLNRLLLDLSV